MSGQRDPVAGLPAPWRFPNRLTLTSVAHTLAIHGHLLETFANTQKIAPVEQSALFPDPHTLG